MILDELYLKSDKFELKLLDDKGFSTCKRGLLNNRGDMATVQSRAKSIKSVGLVHGLRRGPWLIEPQPDGDGKLEMYNWASLLEGAYLAFQNDPQKRCKNTQLAMVTPIKDCKLYTFKMPGHARTFLKEWGNELNSEVTSTTFMEMLRETSAIASGWERRARAMGWTVEGLGNGYDAKRFEYVCAICEHWDTHRSWEISASFFKRAVDWCIDNEVDEIFDPGTSVWNSLEKRSNQTVDFPHSLLQGTQNRNRVFHHVYDIFRALEKSHGEFIVMVIMLTLPQTTALGRCDLLPEGLPNPAVKSITFDMIQTMLLGSMVGSNVVQQLADGSDVGKEMRVLDEKHEKARTRDDAKQKLAEKKAAAAKAKTKAKAKARGGKPPTGMARGKRTTEAAGLPSMPSEEFDTKDAELMDFLDMLVSSRRYLQTIAPGRKEEIDSFTYICLAGALGTSITLNVRGSPQTVKGFSEVRKLFKMHRYRAAGLRPRPSDTDFQGLEAVVVSRLQNACPRGWLSAICFCSTDVRLLTALLLLCKRNSPLKGAAEFDAAPGEKESADLELAIERAAVHLDAITAFLQTNKVDLPLAAHPAATTCLSETLLALLSKLTNMGGTIEDGEQAMRLLVDIAAEQCIRLIPESWVAPLEVVRDAMESEGQNAIRNAMQWGLISESWVMSYRTRLLLHVLHNLGDHTFSQVQGPVTVQTKYVTPLLKTIVEEMIGQLAAGEGANLIKDLCDWTGVGFVAAAKLWVAEALALDAHCKQHCATRFLAKEKSLREEIKSAKIAAVLSSVMSRELGRSVTVDPSIIIFPSQLAQATASFFNEWEGLHKEEVKSNMILKNPLAVLASTLQSRHVQKARDSQAQIVQATTSEAGPKAAAVDAAASSSRTLDQWRTATVSAETCEHGYPSFVPKALLSNVGAFFANLACHEACSPVLRIARQQKEQAETSGRVKKGAESYEIIRDCPMGASSCSMPYWGRVLDDVAATSCKKEFLLPLMIGDQENPHDLKLFLDGSQHINTARGDCCICWLIRPAPAPKAAAADVNNEGAVVQSQDPCLEHSNSL